MRWWYSTRSGKTGEKQRPDSSTGPGGYFCSHNVLSTQAAVRMHDCLLVSGNVEMRKCGNRCGTIRCDTVWNLICTGASGLAGRGEAAARQAAHYKQSMLDSPGLLCSRPAQISDRAAGLRTQERCREELPNSSAQCTVSMLLQCPGQRELFHWDSGRSFVIKMKILCLFEISGANLVFTTTRLVYCGVCQREIHFLILILSLNMSPNLISVND